MSQIYSLKMSTDIDNPNPTWSKINSWEGGVVPTPSTTSTVIYKNFSTVQPYYPVYRPYSLLIDQNASIGKLSITGVDNRAYADIIEIYDDVELTVNTEISKDNGAPTVYFKGSIVIPGTNVTFNVAKDYNMVFLGSIRGSGTITIAGEGKVYFTATNRFRGEVINNGNLSMGDFEYLIPSDALVYQTVPVDSHQEWSNPQHWKDGLLPPDDDTTTSIIFSRFSMDQPIPSTYNYAFLFRKNVTLGKLSITGPDGQYYEDLTLMNNSVLTINTEISKISGAKKFTISNSANSDGAINIPNNKNVRINVENGYKVQIFCRIIGSGNISLTGTGELDLTYANMNGFTGKIIRDDNTIIRNITDSYSSFSSFKKIIALPTTDAMVALDYNGQLWYRGQISNPSYNPPHISSHKFVLITGTENQTWIDIAMSAFHITALRSDGTLWTWGSNNDVLGLGSQNSSYSITQVSPGVTNWKRIVSGQQHTIALRTDGSMWAWGVGNNGQLGTDTTSTQSLPIQIGTSIAEGATGWLEIFAGLTCSFALRAGGEMYSWGSTYNDIPTPGLLGREGASSSIIKVDGSKWAYVSAGSTHTLAIKDDGSLWEARIGTSFDRIGSDTDWASATAVPSKDQYAWTTDAHKTASFYIKKDGRLYVSGFGNTAMLGTGDYNNATMKQIGEGNEWVKVYNASTIMYGECKDGSLYRWGYDASGLPSDHEPYLFQEYIPLKFTKIASGENFTIGIHQNGTIWGWAEGYNTPLQNGIGHRDPGSGYINTPVYPAQIGSDANWKEVSCGRDFIVAIKTDGTLWTWGHSNLIPTTSGPISRPTQIISKYYSNNDWVTVACGSGHAMLIDTAGKLYALGDGSDNRTGGGSTIEGLDRPWRVAGNTTGWTHVSAGSNYSAAIKDGYLYVTGLGGPSTGIPYDSQAYGFTRIDDADGVPAQWKSVACGRNATLGVRIDGSLWYTGSLDNYSSSVSNSFVKYNNYGDIWDRVIAHHAGRASWAFANDGKLYRAGISTLVGPSHETPGSKADITELTPLTSVGTTIDQVSMRLDCAILHEQATNKLLMTGPHYRKKGFNLLKPIPLSIASLVNNTTLTLARKGNFAMHDIVSGAGRIVKKNTNNVSIKLPRTTRIEVEEGSCILYASRLMDNTEIIVSSTASCSLFSTVDVITGNIVKGGPGTLTLETEYNDSSRAEYPIIFSDSNTISVNDGDLHIIGSYSASELTLTTTNSSARKVILDGNPIVSVGTAKFIIGANIKLQIGNGGITGLLQKGASIINNGTLSFSNSLGEVPSIPITGTGILSTPDSSPFIIGTGKVFDKSLVITEGSTIVINGEYVNDLSVPKNTIIKGTGKIKGNLGMASQSILAVGNSPGLLEVTGNLTFNNGAIMEWELSDNDAANENRGGKYDAINVYGDVIINPGAIMKIMMIGTASFVNVLFWKLQKLWNVIQSTSTINSKFVIMDLTINGEPSSSEVNRARYISGEFFNNINQDSNRISVSWLPDSGAGGDPHITTLSGYVYKLPNNEQILEMYNNGEVLISSQMKSLPWDYWTRPVGIGIRRATYLYKTRISIADTELIIDNHSLEILSVTGNLQYTYEDCNEDDYACYNRISKAGEYRCKMLSFETVNTGRFVIGFAKLDNSIIVNDMRICANPLLLTYPASGAIVSENNLFWSQGSIL